MYLAMREHTDTTRAAFQHFQLSTKMKWITFNLSRKTDIDAVLAFTQRKLQDLKNRAGR
jgi:hypothetical protein